ncbi:unnamed protein product [Soboliphyme baturini]|uniref:Reverse transcriptase domain-containing protein n=1 Tax=Soboliphyme baturini TaxID=241478 RepID=A0A183ILR1_9BILA|nr:unnamed protein product [Soboliphyme baturini]
MAHSNPEDDRAGIIFNDANTTKGRATISHKLFTACSEMVFRAMNWKGGININGEQLKPLKFADDMLLLALNANQPQDKLGELDRKVQKSDEEPAS